MFLMTEVSEKNVFDPEHVVLALTRLRDFLVEREKKISRYQFTIRTEAN